MSEDWLWPVSTSTWVDPEHQRCPDLKFDPLPYEVELLDFWEDEKPAPPTGDEAGPKSGS